MLARRSIEIEPMTSLQPLMRCVDERDERDRCLADLCADTRQILEGPVLRCIEQIIRLERAKALLLILSECVHHCNPDGIHRHLFAPTVLRGGRFPILHTST